MHSGHQNQVLQVLFECTKSPLHLTVTSLPQRLVREETVFWKSIYVCQAKDMLIEVYRA